MTTPRRLEQDLPALLAEMYLAGTPDYRDELFEQTATHRQRPAWTFPERWIPMDLAARRLPNVPIPWRVIGVLALIAVILAATLFVVGSRRHAPPPFGPAANGPFVFSQGGDLFIRDSLTSAIRPLLTGDTNDDGPGYLGADNERLVFFRHEGTSVYLMSAAADGSNPVRVLPQLLVDPNPWIQSSTDSRRLAVASMVDGRRIFQVVNVDGTGLTTVPLGDLTLMDFQWRPPDDREFLIRAQKPDGSVDLFTVRTDGSELHALGLPSEQIFGPEYDLSGAGWNQNGDRITYNAVERNPKTGDGQFRMHLVNPDGSGDVRLPAPVDGVNQAWARLSPDGTTIMAQRFTFDPSAVWLVLFPADGSGPAREIGKHHFNGDGTSLDMIWSPDGKSILLYLTKDDFVSIDPATGVESHVDWQVGSLPAWRRDAP